MSDRSFTDQLTWEEKARVNPLWAVMSTPEFDQASGDPASWTPEQLASFFEKGRMLFDAFLKPPLRRAGVEGRDVHVLEYGSGMGRILRAVHAAGYSAAGVDISPTMVANSRLLVPEVTDLHVLAPDGGVPVPDASFDYVYSYAVLQHISRLSQVRRAVLEMCRALKPGGLLRLQYQPASMPFKVPRRQVLRGVNFERHSVVYRWVRLQRRLPVPDWVPAVPVAYLHRHNHWQGVPVRWRTMEEWLNEGGVQQFTLERDPVADWNSVWILGRKDAGAA